MIDQDTAFTLRKKYDNKEDVSNEEISNLLENSDLVTRLTSEFKKKATYSIWRIIALAEIPYANQLEYTTNVINYINDNLSCEEGFSLTGKSDDLLPCYNGMLIEAYSKLGYMDDATVENGVNWIKKYLLLDRNKKSEWKGKGVNRYGGCLKTTPCFVGIVKCIKALVVYRMKKQLHDEELDSVISKGMNYILKHNLYQRLSDSKPITNHILDLTFPASYQLNIIELIELAYLTDKLDTIEVKDSITYLKDKMVDRKYWKVDYIYSGDGYLSFNKKSEKDNWITYLLLKYLLY